MITKEEIEKAVIKIVSAAANIETKYIEIDQELKKHPLQFDNTQLVHLAMMLRGFIKKNNPTGNIKSPQLRKKGLTIKKVIAIVQDQIIES